MTSNNTKAHELAQTQRSISVAEFFEKNRHLLGFDNPKKALLTTIKEAVDNALDACEAAEILPDILIEVIDMGNNRFRIIVEDNGPGVIQKQIPPIFARLLYGSKFHSLKQQRGQQGIGISAAALYGQLTTGRGIRIVSKIHPNEPAHKVVLKIDTRKNKPEIISESIVEWDKDHGTRIELDIEASYSRGDISVDEYIRQTAVINPHANLIYTNPNSKQFIYARSAEQLPKKSKSIKPHPYGVELGRLMDMMKWTELKTLQAFLQNEFSRVGNTTAKTILENAALLPKTKPKTVSREQAMALIESIRQTKIMAPPTDCLSPLGEELIKKGLQKVVQADIYASVTRPTSVYRGNPFIIEVGIAYGGDLPGDTPAEIQRFANRVPLLYQKGACATNESIVKTNWKSYHFKQPTGARPIGPIIILVHISSVWVPFTSEAKEAIAHYPEIVKEIKLALQECGRKIGVYISKKARVAKELKRLEYIKKYIPYVSEALKDLNELTDYDADKIQKILEDILEDGRNFKPDSESVKQDLPNNSETQQAINEYADSVLK